MQTLYLTCVNTAYRVTHLYANEIYARDERYAMILVSWIEGFHDAVGTPCALRADAMLDFFFFFLRGAVYTKKPENDNKICFNFLLILFEHVKLAVSEYIFISLLLRCNLAL